MNILTPLGIYLMIGAVVDYLISKSNPNLYQQFNGLAVLIWPVAALVYLLCGRMYK